MNFSHLSELGIFTFIPKYVQRPKRYQIELGGSPSSRAKMTPRSTESIDRCTTVRVGYFGAMCRVAEFHSAVGGEMHLLRLGRSCYLNEHGMAQGV